MILGMKTLLLSILLSFTALAITPQDALTLIDARNDVTPEEVAECNRPFNAKLAASYELDTGLKGRINRNTGAVGCSPYDAKTYGADLRATQIEHVVAKRTAHYAGLCNARPYKRSVRHFVVDTANLVLASPEVNDEKGSKGPADWLPRITRERNRCAYAATYARVTNEWELKISQRDFDALKSQLSKCPPGGRYDWAC